MFEGAPFKPFEHTVTFFRKMFKFFSSFIENAFDDNSIFFSQKYAHNTKKKIELQGLQIAAFQQRFFFSILVETPYFVGSINTKTYLNHELGPKFFSSSE